MTIVQQTERESVNQPLVSIGMPVYNSAEYLARSIESLLSQSYRNIELVISDNASTDGTEQICQDYARRDSRVRYTRLAENIGGVRNHSTVMELCRGELFMWASGDDLWQPEYVATCVAELLADPTLVAVYTTNTIIDEQGKVVRTLPRGADLTLDSAVARFEKLTDIYAGIQPFYSVMRLATLRRTRKLWLHPGFDRIVFAEIGLLGKLKRIERPLYLRRQHEMQSVEAYPTLRSRYRWIKPSSSSKWIWPHFEYLWAFFLAAMRSAPGVSGRIACIVVLLRWSNWHRKELLADLRMTP